MAQAKTAELAELPPPQPPDEAAAAGLLPLRQARLADQVYELLLLQIARGAYGVGTRLPSEPQLCAEFGVSRPVVREALARLRADKIVRSRRGSGSFVEREPSRVVASLAPSGGIAQMVRAYEFRAGVEAEAAAIAAGRREKRDLAAMEQAIAELAAALQRNEVGDEPDLAFHRAVALATRNPLFIQSIQMLDGSIRSGIVVARRLKQLANSDRVGQVLTEHERVLAAIRGQDAEAARLAMHRHIDSSRDRMLGFAAG
ncbi:transcriptional regulator, GntR family [Tistlia consotensis]|uniref:Transcriptional regulator, GntR family n=1 Tax=Tistlia consotensis USBA 355 TaxID=560819 RepID=A0A1Y6CKS3_9PROT|nr:FCD domain-containing protein [Tistlia consotensis]SMF73698.1 transcriptional regulator, GntR family [Tistlia consotensis USBA 355]SNS28502.1 transcriptional regulator, GntR family [Tistlia consotensis]